MGTFLLFISSMVINVITEDFQNAGCYSNPCRCPLAVAIKRQLNVNNVFVRMGEVRIEEKFYQVTYGWFSDQEIYGGEYKEMSMDQMIGLAKSKPTVEFPTIELELFE